LICSSLYPLSVKTMTYQTQLRPWCIVRQLPEKKHTVVNRYRRYQDADALVKLLRRQKPNSKFLVMFEPPEAIASEPAH
ncbi:MAG: hypothetical protein AAF722_22435, partial [Cyanobacteria bacterium P01_C01_bin.70]